MTTFIDTGLCERVRAAGNQGDFAEVVNKELCGAANVVGTLRWLGEGERFDARHLEGTYQLIYLMEGSGVIRLGGKDYQVAGGAGVFLEPGETASISHAGEGPLKLFCLVVPRLRD